MSKVAELERTVALDYPQKTEVIASNHYAFRISAAEDVQHVAISIDGSDPISCRPAAGYFWYDWSDFTSGQHGVLVIATFADGSAKQTKVRRVLVA